MRWIEQCAAVIPCFNEAARIGAVVEQVREFVHCVVVVDDGSADATAHMAEAAGAIVVRHTTNLGKGASLTKGLRAVRVRGFEWAVTLDGDGQHAAMDLPGLFRMADRGAAPLIVGNRMGNAAAMPWLRRQVNRWMSRRLSALVGQELPDSQCGLRLVRLSAWETLDLSADRFEVESEWLVAFARAGYTIEFAPVTVIYGEEQSKIHPWRDTLRWFRWWARTRQKLQAHRERDVILEGADLASPR